METNQQPLILVVDDAAINRDYLTTILSSKYRIIQAENGSRALEVIRERKNEIVCVLLDINMPILGGLECLERMAEKKWLSTLPVIIISSDSQVEVIRRAYELGAVDYLTRPFDEVIVKHKLEISISLYSKQKKLASMVLDQMKENERMSDMMISILGHTVEFRNRESNLHIANVSSITKILLEELVCLPGQVKYDPKKISLISRAAALHDLGKVSIPDELLNKPGSLTPEEFTMMKKHTIIGAQMLEAEVIYRDEPLVKEAYKICRWHHERYDGKGYPDGLKGDDIPIEAQVVSVADVYDALTSERVYKKAFSHNQAIEMICNNECGVFNPILIRCLQKVAPELRMRISSENESKSKPDVSIIQGVG